MASVNLLFFSSTGALYSFRYSRNDLRRLRVIRIVGPANFKQIERAGVWHESPGLLPRLQNVITSRISEVET